MMHRNATRNEISIEQQQQLCKSPANVKLARNAVIAGPGGRLLANVAGKTLGGVLVRVHFKGKKGTKGERSTRVGVCA
jgi:hypothetical protein